jgi:hypothetical protein
MLGPATPNRERFFTSHRAEADGTFTVIAEQRKPPPLRLPTGIPTPASRQDTAGATAVLPKKR